MLRWFLSCTLCLLGFVAHYCCDYNSCCLSKGTWAAVVQRHDFIVLFHLSWSTCLTCIESCNCTYLRLVEAKWNGRSLKLLTRIICLHAMCSNWGLKQHTLKIKQDITPGGLFNIPQEHRTIKLSSFRALVAQDLPISQPRQYNSYYRCLLQSKKAFHQLLGRWAFPSLSFFFIPSSGSSLSKERDRWIFLQLVPLIESADLVCCGTVW